MPGLPEGMELPDGAEMPEGGGMPGGGAMGGHALKERFLELDAFDGVYKKAYGELYETYFGSGTAAEALDDIAGQAQKAGVDADDLEKAVTTLRTTVTARTEALAKNAEVTG